MMPLIYLACPYNDPDPAIRIARFEAVNRAAAYFMAKGEYVFSPISHTHPIAMAGDLPHGWDHWQGYDRTILSVCHKLYVLQLAGWDKSVGVAGEMQIAAELGIPVFFVDTDPEVFDLIVTTAVIA